jgi:hypothetical protein
MPEPQDDSIQEAQSQLSRLFAAYRQELPDPEPSPQFMPQLWEQIDARQGAVREVKRLAQGFLTAALALSLLIGVFLAWPQNHLSPFYTSTYLELLASEQDQDSEQDEDSAEVELVRVDPAVYETAR